jgi:hypothetical protein
MNEIATVCIEELGVSEEVARALRKVGISNLGQLQSRKNLKEKGIPEDQIGRISLALHQYGALLPAN